MSGNKTLWMRLGVTVPVTEDELFQIMEQSHSDHVWNSGKWAVYNGMVDYDLREEEAKKFLKRAEIDGESYIPDCSFDEHLEWWLKEREKRGLDDQEDEK